MRETEKGEWVSLYLEAQHRIEKYISGFVRNFFFFFLSHEKEKNIVDKYQNILSCMVRTKALIH